MVPGRSSRAVAVIVSLWVLACAAALALATTTDDAVAQGCGGGGSPSPSSSASTSKPPASGLPIPVSLPPVPAPDARHAVPEVERDDPSKKTIVGGTAQQDQQAKCKSTITIAYESGKARKFTGKVGSDEPTCKRARDVTVKKLKRGKDRAVGKAVTNAKGKYSVPSRRAKGRFYAKVAKATVENGDGETITCQGARSRAIRP